MAKKKNLKQFIFLYIYDSFKYIDKTLLTFLTNTMMRMHLSFLINNLQHDNT